MPRPISPIRIEGKIAYVPLTRGYEAIIDAADVSLVEEYNWYALMQRNTVYAVRTDRTGDKQRKVYLHRAILGEPDGLEVDHKDGNGLKNTRDNLRAATTSQNQQNARISKRNTSGFRGVHWDKRDQRWRAYIKVNRKQTHLGNFTTPEAAHAAYCKASARMHGEFGRTE